MKADARAEKDDDAMNLQNRMIAGYLTPRSWSAGLLSLVRIHYVVATSLSPHEAPP